MWVEELSAKDVGKQTFEPHGLAEGYDRNTVVQARGLTKSYRQAQILRGVDLDVRAGEFVAIVGPSGSGKSTLLHILGCVDRADAGELIINGQSITQQNDAKLAQLRNQALGFVFQFFYFQPHLSIAKNLEIPLMTIRLSRRERAGRVRDVATWVGVADTLARRPNQLSGGQLQRAAIARALINSPQVILADEPTGNLDRANTERVLELLLRIKRERGVTLVVVTHDQNVAAVADRVLTMADGRLQLGAGAPKAHDGLATPDNRLRLGGENA